MSAIIFIGHGAYYFIKSLTMLADCYSVPYVCIDYNGEYKSLVITVSLIWHATMSCMTVYMYRMGQKRGHLDYFQNSSVKN